MEVFDASIEKPISLAEAAAWLPRKAGGKKLAIATITRWIKTGHKGVFLEGLVLPGSICTSMESLKRFTLKLSGRSPNERTPAEAAASHQRAVDYLNRRWQARRRGKL